MQTVELKSMPTHGAKPEDLNPAKFKQRLEAARYLTGHKTIMELYAGAGNLSEKVYARMRPRRMVLVDDDPEALKEARVRLERYGLKTDYWPMKNEKFLKSNLGRYPDVTLVDFDAYGTPARVMKSFFDLYRIRRPMVVSFTDGFPTDMRPWKLVDWNDLYSLKMAKPPSLGQICGYHDTMMKNTGSRRGFKSWRINRAFGGKSGRAVYTAYLIRPLST